MAQTIFLDLSPIAKPGDIFRVPFLPVAQVVERCEVSSRVGYKVRVGDRLEVWWIIF